MCRAADLGVLNPVTDPVLANYARKLIADLPGGRERSIDQEVCQAICLMLPMGRATCKSVAQGLGMGMRTLSFTGLVNEVRQELARRYLANGRYRPGEVAALLDSSTHSTFTRWFGAEFRCSPEAWRAALAPATGRHVGRARRA